VFYAADIYGNEQALAEAVVVVGGGEVGVETGLHLAEKGHDVTLLEMLDQLAPDATPGLHYRDLLLGALEEQKRFTYILNVRCTAISKEGVSYRDMDGAEHSIQAGSVVIAAGMQPKSDEALAFFGAGRQMSDDRRLRHGGERTRSDEKRVFHRVDGLTWGGRSMVRMADMFDLTVR